jgi:hypothetical protein
MVVGGKQGRLWRKDELRQIWRNHNQVPTCNQETIITFPIITPVWISIRKHMYVYDDRNICLSRMVIKVVECNPCVGRHIPKESVQSLYETTPCRPQPVPQHI